MRLGRSALGALLARNAVELRFRRRHDKPGYKDQRRMLCTNDMTLLLSVGGKNILNFVPAHGRLPYNAAAYNLVIAWDIFMQDFRAINCDQVDVIAVLPTQPPDKFWDYFNNYLVQMPAQQKMGFMNT